MFLARKQTTDEVKEQADIGNNTIDLQEICIYATLSVPHEKAQLATENYVALLSLLQVF